MSKDQANIKKGNNSWQPAGVTDVINKEPGYRYRWVNKDSDNLAKKQAEKWELLNGLQSDNAKPVSHNRQNDGANQSSVYEKRDVVLARIREEDALGRDAHFNDKSERLTSGLTAHVKKEMGKEGANMHGEITISSRRRAQNSE